MKNNIIFNSAMSISIILILLIIGYKDVKLGLSLIIMIAMFYITYLS